MNNWKTVRLLTYGFLIGTAGVSVLKSADAKSCYTHVTAAIKRGAGSVMKTFTTLKENCEDIAADADEINEKREQAREEREIADAKELLRKAEEKEKEEADTENA